MAEADATGCRQIVLLGAGLDTRAYRMGLPAEVVPRLGRHDRSSGPRRGGARPGGRRRARRATVTEAEPGRVGTAAAIEVVAAT
ncbi:class I SAM-dependent methyltransferase [Nocardia fluminea]|uniref:class I SAM-dependent methyltransferase n=1 Tax=Nocardia fluminea TaxID=134984 RepID=UPI0037F1DF64